MIEFCNIQSVHLAFLTIINLILHIYIKECVKNITLNMFLVIFIQHWTFWKAYGIVKVEYHSSWMISWLVLVGNYIAWDTPNSAILRLYGCCICLKINKSLIIILLYQIIMWAFLNFNTAWKRLDYFKFWSLQKYLSGKDKCQNLPTIVSYLFFVPLEL